MLLLEGNDMWVNLKTSFVDIDELLLFLKVQKFSGYLQFEFSDSQCALFLQLGDVVNGLVALAEERTIKFNPEKDLLSLHYDHAPDKDDGHSAAADRTILESLHTRDWVKTHVVAV